MKRCIAYIRVRGLPRAWRRCLKRAEQGFFLCHSHGDALDGAVLGMLLHEYPFGEKRVSPKKNSTTEDALCPRNGHAQSPVGSAIQKFHV